MNDYKLISNYKANEKYRLSFCELAKNTFALEFEEWFSKGYCNDNYICYSYIHDDKVIANVSINKFDIINNGKLNKALQLGTVMTHKDYRNKGLIRNLMNEVFKDYENEVDFIYLYANDSVLNFYPKFGFVKHFENTYEMDTLDVKLKTCTIRKIDTKNEADTVIINRLSKGRTPISQQLGIVNDEWPLKTYCNYMYKDNLYYIPEDDAIVIMDRQESQVNLHDILSTSSINLDNFIEKILTSDDKKLIFNFIPESKKYKIQKGIKDIEDDTLFIKNYKGRLNGDILFPPTSHT